MRTAKRRKGGGGKKSDEPTPMSHQKRRMGTERKRALLDKITDTQSIPKQGRKKKKTGVRLTTWIST